MKKIIISGSAVKAFFRSVNLFRIRLFIKTLTLRGFPLTVPKCVAVPLTAR